MRFTQNNNNGFELLDPYNKRIEIIAMTTIMAYLRLKSKSVWPAIILHASHNYIDQVICGPLTSANKQAYFVGETGLITAFMLIIVAIIVIRKIIREAL